MKIIFLILASARVKVLAGGKVLMLYIPIIVSIFSIIFSLFLARRIEKIPDCTGKLVESAKNIRQNSFLYLKEELKIGGPAIPVLFLLFWILLGFESAIGFLLGAAVLATLTFAAFLLLNRSYLKVLQARKTGKKQAQFLIFQSGLAIGFLALGAGLFFVSFFHILGTDFRPLIAFCFGASLLSFFSSFGSRVLNREIAARMEAEQHELIGERNLSPLFALIADNLGNCGSLIQDLFLNYLIAVTAAMLLGSLIFPQNSQLVFLPLCIVSLSILSSLVAVFFVFFRPERSKSFLPYKGLIVSAILFLIGLFPLLSSFLEPLGFSVTRFYLPFLISLAMLIGLFLIARYFLFSAHPAGKSADLRRLDILNIIAGFSRGVKTTALSLILILAGILIIFFSAGIYGFALASLSLISLTGSIIALALYLPFGENASAVVKIIGNGKELPPSDLMDNAGKRGRDLTAIYAFLSAGLAVFLLFFVFIQNLAVLGAKIHFFLGDPKVLSCLFLGGILPFYITSQFAVSQEGRLVRRILKELLFPLSLLVAPAILIGFILGHEALGGFLAGNIANFLLFSIFLLFYGFFEKTKISRQTVVGEKYSLLLVLNSASKTLSILALLMIKFFVK